MYLEELRASAIIHLNVLSYWKANQCRYPIMASMARDLLAILVTTIASELSFNVSGQILDKYRNCLLPSNLEALICTRDWLFVNQDSNQITMEDLTMDVLDDKVVDLDCEDQSLELNFNSIF